MVLPVDLIIQSNSSWTNMYAAYMDIHPPLDDSGIGSNKGSGIATSNKGTTTSY